MTATLVTPPRTSPIPPEKGFLQRLQPGRVVAAVVMLALVVGGIWASIELKINIASLIDSRDNAINFIGRMFPLDFPPSPGETAALLWETLSIVLLATALSVVLSFFLALLAAHNTSPGTASMMISRFLIVLARAIPDLVLAVLFFRMFGLGGLPGILAWGGCIRSAWSASCTPTRWRRFTVGRTPRCRPTEPPGGSGWSPATSPCGPRS